MLKEFNKSSYHSMPPLVPLDPEKIAEELQLPDATKERLKRINDDTLHLHERFTAAFEAKKEVDEFIASTLDGIRAAEGWLTHMEGVLSGLGKSRTEIDAAMKDVRARNADTLRIRFEALMSLRRMIVALTGVTDKPGDQPSKYRAAEQAKTTVKHMLMMGGRYGADDVDIAVKHLESLKLFELVSPGKPQPSPEALHTLTMSASKEIHGKVRAGGAMHADSKPGNGRLSAELIGAVNLIRMITVVPPTQYDKRMMPALAKRVPADVDAMVTDPDKLATIGAKTSVEVRTSTGKRYVMYFETADASHVDAGLKKDVKEFGKILEVNYVTDEDMLHLLEEMDNGDKLLGTLRVELEGVAAGTKIVLEGKNENADFAVVAVDGYAPLDPDLAKRIHDAIAAAPMNYIDRGYHVEWVA